MAVCAVLYRQEEKAGLPWLLLGLFGLLHGLNEWLDMLAISLGDSPAFSTVRLGIMAASFVVLAEFGRQGLRATGRGPGIWMYLPLAACVITGGSAGGAELNAVIRYSLGLVSGLLATAALWRAARSGSADSYLAAAAVVMALYAVAAGAVVPRAAFFPASLINHQSFLAFAGMPIQLVRGILAVVFTVLLWEHHQKRRGSVVAETGQLVSWSSGSLLAFIILLLLAAGWVGTQLFDREAMRDVREDILQLTRTAAAGINGERLRNVLDGAGSAGNQDYPRLRRQLIALHEANLHLHLLRIFSFKEGQAFVVVDSAADWDTEHKKPGARYQKPPQVLFDVYASGGARTVGPYKDEDGTFVSGFAPITDPATGKTLAVMGIDISAASWHEQEAHYRLLAIATTLVFSTLVTSFFIISRRMVETAALLAASRRQYEASQEQKRQELEAMNRNLENLVALRTAKLEESNRELQYFAYIASHDLQEPLRTITSFIQLLGKRYSDRLDKDAHEFLGFISDGAIRMQQLINDLLTYSRVETKGKPFAPFNGERALEHALANLRLSASEAGAEITHDPLPCLHGDEVQMAQLFQNLIGNAIKFRSDQPPRIHIGCTELADAWEINVSDNGIGIESRFFERIFEIFQRLNSRAQYDGTGIGLAVCKKIVERHGGKIQVESEPGRGTTFRFTIAKGEAPHTAVVGQPADTLRREQRDTLHEGA